MPAERLWTNQQLIGFGETVATMRKMRNAVTTDGSPPQSIIDRAVSILRKPEQQAPTKNGEVVLFDAEKLGIAFGNFVAARLSKTSNGEIECEEWQDTLVDTQKEYSRYRTITFANTTIQTQTTETINRLNLLGFFPLQLLKWDLIINNNFGVKDIDELLATNLGVIAPLSNDYSIACTYRSYLERTRGRSFVVKPAALSRNLKVVVLPKDQEGRPFFEPIPKIVFYIDITDSGKTGKALYDSVQDEYHGKVIVQPSTQKTSFAKKKIREAFLE